MIDLTIMKAGQCRHLECIALRGGRIKEVPFPSLFFLLQHPTYGPCLIDTGYGSNMSDALNEFPFNIYGSILPVEISNQQTAERQLTRLGISPNEVRHLIITHFHVDHIGGLKDFPNATFWSSSTAWNSVKRLSGIRALCNGFFPSMIPSDFEARLRPIESLRKIEGKPGFETLGQNYDLFGDKSVLLVPLPGHAKGQFGVLVQERAGNLTLIAADACWTSKAYKECRMPSIFTYPFIDDVQSYRHTLRALHAIHSSGAVTHILPSHCAEIAACARDVP